MPRNFRSPALADDVDNYRGRDPSRGVRLVPLPKLEPDALTEPQLDRLLHGVSDPLDKAIIATLACTGVRAGELLNLTVHDVRVREGFILIRLASFYSPGHSKKNAERHLPVWRSYGAFLQDYMARLRPRLVPADSPWLLAKPNGEPFSGRGLHALVSRYLDQAEIVTNERGPHLLRRTFACALFDHGYDLAEIALYLGHSESTGVQVVLKNYLTKDRRKRASQARPAQRAEDPFGQLKALRVRRR